jgi:hypothetical protein
MRYFLTVSAITLAVLFSGLLALKIDANAQTGATKACPTGFILAGNSAGCICRAAR